MFMQVEQEWLLQIREQIGMSIIQIIILKPTWPHMFLLAILFLLFLMLDMRHIGHHLTGQQRLLQVRVFNFK